MKINAIKRNYISRFGEIDIIAQKGKHLAFVEVKTTASDAAEDYKRPAAAVTFEKQKNRASE